MSGAEFRDRSLCHNQALLLRVQSQLSTFSSRSDRATPTMRLIASSISASVVVAPRLKRTDERRRSSGMRMAIRVGEGRVEPLAQAEPSEAAMPAMSSCIKRASPSRPGKPTLRVWGSRLILCDRAVADHSLGSQGGRSGRIQGGRARLSSAGDRSSNWSCHF